VNVYEQIFVGKLQMSEYQDTENKHGVLGGTRLKNVVCVNHCELTTREASLAVKYPTNELMSEHVS